MFKLLISCGAVALLLGCSNHNLTPHTLQFSGETVAYPDNYQVEAARLVRDRSADPEFARVSVPQPTLGETAFSPKRWYVCVRGIPAPAPKSTAMPPLSEAVENFFDPDGGVYDVLLIFSNRQRPSIREGYDSPLCKDQSYELITAQPPLI